MLSSPHQQGRRRANVATAVDDKIIKSGELSSTKWGPTHKQREKATKTNDKGQESTKDKTRRKTTKTENKKKTNRKTRQNRGRAGEAL